MKTFKKNGVFLLFIVVLVLALLIGGLHHLSLPKSVAYAGGNFTLNNTKEGAEKEIKIYFYHDRDDLYKVIDYNGEELIFPEYDKEREGYIFKGWTDGGLGIYLALDTFTGDITNDKIFYAVLEGDGQEEATDWGIVIEIIFYTLLALILSLIAISYYWFVIKKRRFKDFKKLFRKGK